MDIRMRENETVQLGDSSYRLQRISSDGLQFLRDRRENVSLGVAEVLEVDGYRIQIEPKEDEGQVVLRIPSKLYARKM